jgi:methylmalonyl-CoA mutase C-terminal domain/subunit
MKEEGLDHVLIVIGGIIPDEDIPKLKEMGVAEVFLPGTPLEQMTKYVSQEVEKRRKHANK